MRHYPMAKILLTTAMAWGVHSAATAQNTGTVKVAQLDANTPLCKKELAQYTETLRFLRSSAGEQIASRVASGYVSEAELDKVVAASGPCAATQLLREKKAFR